MTLQRTSSLARAPVFVEVLLLGERLQNKNETASKSEKKNRREVINVYQRDVTANRFV